MRMTVAMVPAAGLAVWVLRGQLRVGAGGADLQQERCAARRHEPDRHIGAKQQDGKHQAGSQGASMVTKSMMTSRVHTSRQQCQSARARAMARKP